MLKKIFSKTVILVLLPIFSICQIINDDEGLFGLKPLKIKSEIDTLSLSLPRAGNYYITFRDKINIHDDVDVRAVDVNYKEYEIKKLDSILLLQIDKSTYMYLIFRVKNKNLVDPQVSVALGYPLNPDLDLPSFVIKDIEGMEVTSESLKGKIVVMNYWALSCKPCIEEIPRLNKLAKSYVSDEDVVFFALSPDNKDKVNKFLEKQDFNYRMFVGRKNIENIQSPTDLAALPFHLIIEREGKIAFNFYGYTKKIDELLKERIERLY
jgi:peroxiredoxin